MEDWRQNSERKGTWKDAVCLEEGCNDAVSAKGRCPSHYAKDRRARGIHPPSVNPKSNRNRHLRHRYGIDLVDYEQMFTQQGGRCSICRSEPIEKSPARWDGKLCVDHDHTTGKVRGLLCNSCNLAIGYCDNNNDLLNAARYVHKHADTDSRKVCHLCLDLPLEIGKAMEMFGAHDTEALLAIVADVTRYCGTMHD